MCSGRAAELENQPWLVTSSWWASHLLEHAADAATPAPGAHAKPPRGGGRAPPGGALQRQEEQGARRLLQWVYGRVVNSRAAELLLRHREFLGGRERAAALLDLYDDLAYGWRSLQAVLDQRARLEELRKGARAQFAMVRMRSVLLCVRCYFSASVDSAHAALCRRSRRIVHVRITREHPHPHQRA